MPCLITKYYLQYSTSPDQVYGQPLVLLSDLSEILVARCSGVLEGPLLSFKQFETYHALEVASAHVYELIPL